MYREEYKCVITSVFFLFFWFEVLMDDLQRTVFRHLVTVVAGVFFLFLVTNIASSHYFSSCSKRNSIGKKIG